MDGLSKTYLDNLTRAFAYSKPQITADMSDEQIIDTIRQSADALFHIHRENDDILKEILFSRTAETLTADEVEELKELADALFDYNRSADMGVAHYIHKLLYQYAQYHQDVDLEIRELYHLAITLLYMNVTYNHPKTDMFSAKVGEYFGAGTAFLDRYEEFENPETRSYILRCLGNMKFAMDSKGSAPSLEEFRKAWDTYMKFFNHGMEVFQSPHYRELNPELPWEHYVYTMHYDRVKFLSGLRNYPAEEDIAQAVLESAEYVYQHQEQIARTQGRNVGVRTQYVYYGARYHAGVASLQELMDALFRTCEHTDLHDFSGDNIWAVLTCPLYLIFYSKRLPEEERAAAQPRVDNVMRRQREFIFLLPKNEYALQVAQSMQTIAGYVPADDHDFSQRTLDYILACHAPTFVHSKMVALLSRRVCQQLLDTNPQFLDGTFGFQDAAQSREELLEQAYQSGLYHDLGKCMLLNYVGLYTRRLLDEEFACIKLHPTLGCGLLNILKMPDISDAAYYHHCTYDGSGGYPIHLTSCPPRVRPMVDIITVVDSLDAGTDNVGRSYAAAKTYGQIVEELRQWKGTRYAPYIVELFDDPEFYEEIGRLIEECRLQVYLDAYRNNGEEDETA